MTKLTIQQTIISVKKIEFSNKMAVTERKKKIKADTHQIFENGIHTNGHKNRFNI